MTTVVASGAVAARQVDCARAPTPSGGTVIDNTYNAQHLLVLEGLEAVRKRPGMYIGSTDTRGLMHCLWEIIDNAVDEALAGVCTRIEVTLHPDGSAEVHDNGRGIPVDKEPKTGLSGVEVVFTKLHAGGKFGGGSYVATGGLHGVGASVVNALSARLDVEVDRSPATQRMSFRRVCPASSPARAPGPPSRRSRACTRASGWARRSPAPGSASGPTGRSSPRTPTFVYDELVTRARQTSFIVPGPRARDARPARRRAGRGAFPARRRHHRVLRLPRRRRAGDRGAPAPGQRPLHRDGPAARRQGPHDPAGRRARAARRRRAALGDRLRDRGALLRQRHRHAQGRHPRRRLRGGADQDVQRRAAGVQDAQGRRARRDQGRRPGGPHRRRDGAAGRAAVRGPDQGGARHPGGARRSSARSSARAQGRS